MSYFLEDTSFGKEKITKMVAELGVSKVAMEGVANDLKRLKPLIEAFYKEHIFYLSYWKGECAYHGWSWLEDDGRMANMAKITDGITERFNEIYALILAGLGEDPADDG